jgi:hypothetical protein
VTEEDLLIKSTKHLQSSDSVHRLCEFLQDVYCDLWDYDSPVFTKISISMNNLFGNIKLYFCWLFDDPNGNVKNGGDMPPLLNTSPEHSA